MGIFYNELYIFFLVMPISKTFYDYSIFENVWYFNLNKSYKEKPTFPTLPEHTGYFQYSMCNTNNASVGKLCVYRRDVHLT